MKKFLLGVLVFIMFFGISGSALAVSKTDETAINARLDVISKSFSTSAHETVRDFLSKSARPELSNEIFMNTPFKMDGYTLTFTDTAFKDNPDKTVKVSTSANIDIKGDDNSPYTQEGVLFTFTKESNEWKLVDTDLYTLVKDLKGMIEGVTSTTSSSDSGSADSGGVLTTTVTKYNMKGGALPMTLFFGVFLIPFILALIAGIFLGVIPMWKLFKKAGKPGWASIVPIYNIVVMLEIGSLPGWWVLLMFIPFVNIVIGIIALSHFLKAFGKSTGFLIGTIFLPFIFIPILGYGKSQYVGYTATPSVPPQNTPATPPTSPAPVPPVTNVPPQQPTTGM